jgi:hypothetical protein
MTCDLELLKQARALLIGNCTTATLIEIRDKLATVYDRLDSEVSSPSGERSALNRAFLLINKEIENARPGGVLDTHGIGPCIFSVIQSIEKRTIGLNGWPLRK